MGLFCKFEEKVNDMDIVSIMLLKFVLGGVRELAT